MNNTPSRGEKIVRRTIPIAAIAAVAAFNTPSICKFATNNNLGVPSPFASFFNPDHSTRYAEVPNGRYAVTLAEGSTLRSSAGVNPDGPNTVIDKLSPALTINDVDSQDIRTWENTQGRWTCVVARIVDEALRAQKREQTGLSPNQQVCSTGAQLTRASVQPSTMPISTNENRIATYPAKPYPAPKVNR